MREFLRVLGVALLLGAAAPSMAWGPQGHQTVGAIADRLIAGTAAARKVKAILGSETLQQAALWADCAKGVTEKPPYHYVIIPIYSECQPFQTAAGQRAMVAYVKRNLSACHPSATQEVCHKQYHYADVAIQRDVYAAGEVGTSNHDLVHAILACIAVLQWKPSPPPFAIRSRKEALRLLAHYIGDLHQPLHIGAVYLDPAGHLLDPDSTGLVLDSETQGGNLLKDGSKKLHGEWDAVPASLEPAAFADSGATLAAAVPATARPIKDWPAAWATETVLASHSAYAGLVYGPEQAPGTTHRSWPVTEPASYAADRAALQKEQVVKAGARLARLLEALWP